MIKSAFVRYFSDYFTIILDRSNDENDVVLCSSVFGCDFGSPDAATASAQQREVIEAPNNAFDLSALRIDILTPA